VVTNKEVAEKAGIRPLSKTIMSARMRLLGHVLRRAGSDPSRAVSYDSFDNPKELRAKKTAGYQRLTWTFEMIRTVEEALDSGSAR